MLVDNPLFKSDLLRPYDITCIFHTIFVEISLLMRQLVQTFRPTIMGRTDAQRLEVDERSNRRSRAQGQKGRIIKQLRKEGRR